MGCLSSRDESWHSLAVAVQTPPTENEGQTSVPFPSTRRRNLQGSSLALSALLNHDDQLKFLIVNTHHRAKGSIDDFKVFPKSRDIRIIDPAYPEAVHIVCTDRRTGLGYFDYAQGIEKGYRAPGVVSSVTHGEQYGIAMVNLVYADGTSIPEGVL
jgi:hypothetical protein